MFYMLLEQQHYSYLLLWFLTQRHWRRPQTYSTGKSLECIFQYGEALSWEQENYEEIMKDLFTISQELGCRMSVKIHYLHSHLGKFANMLGDVRKIKKRSLVKILMGERCQGLWKQSVMAHYCWRLMSENLEVVCQRTVNKRKLEIGAICQQCQFILYLFILYSHTVVY